MVKKITLFFLMLAGFCGFCQNIQYSNQLTVSVLTCGAGDQIYSHFGHSAFRVQDHGNDFDVVYNYGMFDFSKPNFTLNFVKGKLYYMLGYSNYYQFLQQYQYENRSVVLQKLNLTNAQSVKLVAYLQNNAKPENATYQYTFFHNNCATKIRDVLETVFPNQIVFEGYLTTNYSQRDLINHNIPHNNWLNVGINMALGSVIDTKATPRFYQFLPEYISKSFAHATFNGSTLVAKQEVVLNETITATMFNFLSPYVVFTVISLLIVLLTYFDYKKAKRNRYLDFLLLFITGFLGVAVLVLWLGTYHAETKGNLNVLWAFAPNVIVAFMMLKKQPIKKIVLYYAVLILLMFFTFVIWLLQVEMFALALLPIFVALLVRYVYVCYFLNRL